MAQSADRGGRNKRHREDEEDGDTGGGGLNRLPPNSGAEYEYAAAKRRALGGAGRRSDSASTWRKRQRKGSLGSGGRYHPNNGFEGGADGVGDVPPPDLRKQDLSARPPPPLNEDELSDVRYGRSSAFSPSQGRVPQQRVFSGGHSRDPSPLNHRDAPPNIMPAAGMPPGRSTDTYSSTYGMTPVRPAPSNRQPIDDSARALHSSKSAVMNAIATIGLPFLQYELTATEARFPPPEEGHLFAALAVDISARRAAQRAHAAARAETAAHTQANATPPERGKDPANTSRRQLVLKHKSLSARKAQMLDFLALHTGGRSVNDRPPTTFGSCPCSQPS
eukprot:Gregarina_sp_Pseudo_9__1776@NODE_2207_length_1097_cov_6_182420_g2032_i0_p1_GENE_NODE_2207_length_1097_cov_6_182420_g2032_i0NODE_2207_length_1097_cov_6_182420_g2032_i0_p1_ORF_typecomplete_len334_score84_13_NODE_2207_length_1097_cov_6_182420_g2032_i0821083